MSPSKRLASKPSASPVLPVQRSPTQRPTGCTRRRVVPVRSELPSNPRMGSGPIAQQAERRCHGSTQVGGLVRYELANTALDAPDESAGPAGAEPPPRTPTLGTGKNPRPLTGGAG